MENKLFFYDFGKAAFGRLSVEIAGVPGTEVEIAIGENALAGRVNRTPGGFCCFKSAKLILDSPRNIYKFEIPKHRVPKYTVFTVMPPDDEEVAPFRYAEVVGDCEVIRFIRQEVFPEWDETAAHFESSDCDLNRIWEFCKYSMKATAAFGVFIDGERERCPYEGDAYINQLGWFCCSRDGAIPRRTIELFKEHRTWPIEWSLLMPQIVRDYVLYSGDEAYLETVLPELKSRLLDELENSDGLIGGNDFYRELIDWPMNERDGYESPGVSLVPNCMRYSALMCMAELTGDRRYTAKAENLQSQILQKMFVNGKFVDSPGSPHTAQHSLFFPVATGVVAPDAVPELGKLDIRCSVYAVQFLLDALYMGKYGQQALELMRSRGLRSWLHMIDDLDATIALEAWDASLKPNLDWNHAWGAAPANIIPRRLCGIRPLKPGFREFIFDPQPGDLKFFKSLHPTPEGSIEVEYDSGKFSVKMPGNCCAVYRNRIYDGTFSGTLNAD